MAQSRRWVFTVNNPAGELDTTWDKLRYVSWQLEEGENHTPHWQGYVELNTNVKLGGMKKWLPTAHFEIARGDRDTARAYTRKDDTRVDGPWEYGEFGAGGQGRRSDVADACDYIAKNGFDGVAAAYPEVYVKFHRGLKEYARTLEAPLRDEDFAPRDWQSKILDLLRRPSDDRTVFWVADTLGGRGKSRLARHICCELGGIQLTGRIQDMAYAYDKQPIVVFNITRAQVEHSDHIYTFAEMLKDGYLFSTKYESVAKRFRPPHVIVFANVFPADGKWSADRVKVFDLNHPDMRD